MNPIDGDFDDELLLARNPNGGRPQKLGSMIVDREKHTFDVKGVLEETFIRYHLGYCNCGRKIMIGPKRAMYLVQILKKNGLGESPKIPLRVWLARVVLRIDVDNSWKSQ